MACTQVKFGLWLKQKRSRMNYLYCILSAFSSVTGPSFRAKREKIPPLIQIPYMRFIACSIEGVILQYFSLHSVLCGVGAYGRPLCSLWNKYYTIFSGRKQ